MPARPPRKPATLASTIHGMSRPWPWSSTVTAIGVAKHRRPERPRGQRNAAGGEQRRPQRRGRELAADGDAEGDGEEHREGAGQPRRPRHEMPGRQLGHRDRQREARGCTMIRPAMVEIDGEAPKPATAAA